VLSQISYPCRILISRAAAGQPTDEAFTYLEFAPHEIDPADQSARSNFCIADFKERYDPDTQKFRETVSPEINTSEVKAKKAACSKSNCTYMSGQTSPV
jgi:hypothetical protein